MSAKIEFRANEPVDVALQYPEGRNVPSNYGDGSQVMYTTVDGRKMYLSPTVAAKIAALKPQPGQMLRIVKRERASGARGFDWTVEKLGEQRDGTYVLPKSAGPTAPPPSFSQPGVAHHSGVTLPAQITAPALRRQEKSAVERHCCRLIDLQAAMLDYASRYGGAVTPEDVRTYVCTVYIQAGRSGQLRPRTARRAG